MKTKVLYFFLTFLLSLNIAFSAEQVLLLHMDDFLFMDSSYKSHAVIPHGDVTRAIGEGKFGDAAYFDGNGDFLEIYFTDDFQFLKDDFTIDFWIKPLSNQDHYLLNFAKLDPIHYDILSLRIITFSAGDFDARMFNDGIEITLESTQQIVHINEWQHVALTRKDKKYYLYFDGKFIASSDVTENEIFSTAFVIGKNAYDNYFPGYFNGYIDELRIIKGFAAWSTESNITVPTEQYNNTFCDYSLNIDNFCGNTQQPVSIPIMVSDFAIAPGIEGIDLTIDFDPEVLEAKGFTLTGGVLEGNYLYNVGLNTPGKILASISANSEPFAMGPDIIIGFIEFNVLAESNSALTVSEIIINEKAACIDTKNILFEYSFPSSLPSDSPISDKNYIIEANTPLSITFTVNDPDTPISDLMLFAKSSDDTIIPSNNILFSKGENSITMTINPAQDQIAQSPIGITIKIQDDYSELISNIYLNFKVFHFLAGNINYYTGTNQPVPNVILALYGEKDYTVTSDESGRYTFNNIEPGSYSLVAIKDDDLSGLGADDATRIRRFKVGDNVSFNCYQKLAADVTMDGTIGAVDSSRVAIGSAKIDADLEACFQNDSCIHWIFVKPLTTTCDNLPSNMKPEGIAIEINDSSISDMNLVGIRLGDVTGNFESAGSNNHPLSCTNTYGMTFNFIPDGTFVMGSPEGEVGKWTAEDQHTVILTKPFYMQTTEITRKQWKAVMGSNSPYVSSCSSDDCPVVNVSWNSIQSFIQNLNQQVGEDLYALPTESQWEYAARSGTTTALANGNLSFTECNLDPVANEIAWYCYNSGNKPHPVAQKISNAWGLFDMHGNVWEFCQDWYDTYPLNAVTDPEGPSTGTHKVIRGGCWAGSARGTRSAFRDKMETNLNRDHTGFRLIKIIP